jgi:hypothetical protein
MQIRLKNVHYVYNAPDAASDDASDDARRTNRTERARSRATTKKTISLILLASPLYLSTTTTTSGAASSSSHRTATWCCRPSGPHTANHPPSAPDTADGDARCPPALALAAANNFLLLARTLNTTSVATSAIAPAMKHAITRTVAARSTPPDESTTSSQSDDDVDVAFTIASRSTDARMEGI